MSVKSLRGILLSVLAAAMLLVFSSSVWAASKITVVDPDNASSGKTGGDYELERDMEGGIHLECLGLKLLSNYDDYVFATYAVTSENDTVIKIGTDVELFDNEGRKFKFDEIHIGDNVTKEREIIGGVRTIVIVAFYTGIDKYNVARVYPRLTFVINGKKLTFRGVQGNS
jgi:hypothetical protein